MLDLEREGELQRVRAIFRSLTHPAIVRLDAGQTRETVLQQALAALAGAIERKPR